MMTNSSEIFSSPEIQLPTPLKTIAIGIDQARAYMERIVRHERIDKERRELGPGILQSLHKRVLFYLPHWAGNFRISDETRIGGRKVAPAKNLYDLVYVFESWLEKEIHDSQQVRYNLDGILRIASAAHYGVVAELHPFEDGNGRVARVLTNGILMAGAKECSVHGVCLLPVPILREPVNVEEVKRLILAGKEPKLTPYLRAIEDSTNKWDLTPFKIYLASKWEASISNFLENLRIKYHQNHKNNTDWKRELNEVEKKIVEKMDERQEQLRQYGQEKHQIDKIPDFFTTRHINVRRESYS
ncbi:MAG: Fic family protein [Candidatus Daviesbacteria bacterium]